MTGSAQHVRQPGRMVARQMLPPACSCGEAWPCPVATGEAIRQMTDTLAELKVIVDVYGETLDDLRNRVYALEHRPLP
jgi:hypothetical protein